MPERSKHGRRHPGGYPGRQRPLGRFHAHLFRQRPPHGWSEAIADLRVFGDRETGRAMKTKTYALPQPSQNPWPALGCRLLIGGIFIYSGFENASAPAEEFAAVIQAYYILPPDWTLPFAQIAPWIELILGV